MQDNLPNLAEVMETVNDQVQDTGHSALAANASTAQGQGIGQAPVGVPQPRQIPFRANRTQAIEEGINGLISHLLDKKFVHFLST